VLPGELMSCPRGGAAWVAARGTGSPGTQSYFDLTMSGRQSCASAMKRGSSHERKRTWVRKIAGCALVDVGATMRVESTIPSWQLWSCVRAVFGARHVSAMLHCGQAGALPGSLHAACLLR
jgi:hypothetical protein